MRASGRSDDMGHRGGKVEWQGSNGDAARSLPCAWQAVFGRLMDSGNGTARVERRGFDVFLEFTVISCWYHSPFT